METGEPEPVEDGDPRSRRSRELSVRISSPNNDSHNVQEVLHNYVMRPSAIRNIIQSRRYVIIICIATVFGIIGDDIGTLVLPPKADPLWGALTAVVLVLFIIDFVLHVVYVREYRWSLYMLLDALACLSVIIPMMTYFTDYKPPQGGASIPLVKLGRLARLAIRLTKILRFLKFMNSPSPQHMISPEELINIVDEMDKNGDEIIDLDEFTAQFGNTDAVRKAFDYMDIDGSGYITRDELLQLWIDVQRKEQGSSMHVGNTLFNQITKKIALGILLLFFGMVASDLIRAEVLPDDGQTVTTMMAEVPESSFLAAMGASNPSIIEVKLKGQVIFSRNQEGRKSEYSTYSQKEVELTFSNRKEIVLDAILNIATSVWVTILLLLGNYVLYKVVDTLLLQPVEKMVNVVRHFQKNPLGNLEGEDTAKEESETSYLLEMLRRMTAMLQVSVGHAGASIIARSLSYRGRLSVVVPGLRVEAVFVFVDIRQFTDLTELLKERTIVFLNMVANIVHQAAVQFGGQPNRNMGDAFLLTWKVPDCRSTQEQCGNALTSMIQMLQTLATASVLKAFDDQFGSHHKVGVGVGMHYGWAIEGSVGSQHKIDATYISPHVNTASRVESLTRLYAVGLLLTEELYENLEPEKKSFTRMLDRVKMKGCKNPTSIYSIAPSRFAKAVFADVPLQGQAKRQRLSVQLKKINDQLKLSAQGMAKARSQSIHERRLSEFQFAPSIPGSQEVPLSKSCPVLQEVSMNGEMTLEASSYKVYDHAITEYLEGRWAESREALDSFLALVPQDGPALALRNFLESYAYMCPTDWPGFRTFLEK